MYVWRFGRRHHRRNHAESFREFPAGSRLKLRTRIKHVEKPVCVVSILVTIVALLMASNADFFHLHNFYYCIVILLLLLPIDSL